MDLIELKRKDDNTVDLTFWHTKTETRGQGTTITLGAMDVLELQRVLRLEPRPT